MDENVRRELDELKQLCADLQNQIKKMDHFVRERGRSQHEFNGAVCDHFHQLEATHADFQSRLLVVEKHCFPGIKQGHDLLRQVIGIPENEEYCRFDYRERGRSR